MNPQDTPAEPTPDLQLEIAHLLLIDVVGYSKLLLTNFPNLQRLFKPHTSFAGRAFKKG